MSFRTFQAISDLRAAALSLSAKPPFAIAQAGPEVVDQYQTRLAAGCALGPDPPETLRQAVCMAAASPEDGSDGFLAATCMIVADRLQGGRSCGDLAWEWSAHHLAYRDAPPPVRAALMNGFDMARGWGLAPDDVWPNPPDRVTQTADAITPDLIEIARAITPDDLAHVSRADYGIDAEQHLRSLKQTLAHSDAAIPTMTGGSRRRWWSWCPMSRASQALPGAPR